MIRAVLFDLGNVLVAFDHGITLRRLEEATGVAVEAIRPVVFGELERDFDRGALSAGEFFREVERRAALPPLPHETWVEAWRDIFTPLPEAEAILQRLDDGLGTAIVSNTNEVHWEGVGRVTGVASRVDALALSFRVGSLKPEPAIFRHALDALGAAPEEAVYADDRPDLVAAAAALGLDAFVVDGTATLEAGLESRGLLKNRTDARLQEGIDLFRSGRFFEAHEEWEAIWMGATGDEKRALQGLIQLAAGCVHVGRGNVRPATRLFGLALEKIEPSLPSAFGLDLEILCEALRRAVSADDVAAFGDLASYFPLGRKTG